MPFLPPRTVPVALLLLSQRTWIGYSVFQYILERAQRLNELTDDPDASISLRKCGVERTVADSNVQASFGSTS